MSCLTSAFATVNAVNGTFAPAPAVRRLAALAVGAESALLGLAAILYIVLAAVDDGDARGLSLGLAGLCAACAIGLGFLATSLLHARRWAVSPALTWQVLQGFAGAYAVTVGYAVLGWVALALAAAAGISLALIARAFNGRGEASAR